MTQQQIYGIKTNFPNNLLPTYFIPDSPIGNFFFVLKRVINFPDERKEHM